VVMHAMAGELDMRKFSGLKRVLPKTRWLMLIGCLALAGCPPFSGFFSKDEIVGAAWATNRFLAAVMLFTAFLTAYYTFRLYFRVFEGPEILPEPPKHPEARHDVDPHLAEDAAHHGHATADAHGHNDHHHNHEPAMMIVPLVVLAIGAIFAGVLNYPERASGLGSFLGQSPSFEMSFNRTYKGGEANPAPFGQFAIAEEQHERDPAVAQQDAQRTRMLMIVSGLISLLGIYMAYLMHLKDREAAEKLAAQHPLVIDVLEHKYWFDEIYQNGIIEPLRKFGEILFAIDRFVIDGVVWIISFIPQAGGYALKLTTQRQGQLQGYAVTMLLGIAIILLVVFL